ncbi:MAG: PKD domain-containing protein [Candidatus Diapherotrites archaeon]|nr:PKD domain-containing protein [Candidatus Diapherotrites archaeon]
MERTRRCVIAAVTAILFLSMAFAFIGPGFGQLVKTIKVNPVENTIEIQAPEAAPTPVPEVTEAEKQEETTVTIPGPEIPVPPGPPDTSERITCKAGECGSLKHGHVFPVETAGLTRFDFSVTPHGNTKKVEIYVSPGGFFHKIAEEGIPNPNKKTTFTVVTNQDVAQVLIHMPNSRNAQSTTRISPLDSGGPMPLAAHTSLWSDTCGNNIGYSSNPKEPHCAATGKKDCCAWYQRWHVHDMGTLISQNVSINVDFKSGLYAGCTDTVNVTTSANNVTWAIAGTFPSTSIDTDNSPGYPQSWATESFTIKNYPTPFRFVKVEIPKCANDWSYVTVTDAPSNQPPTANFTSPDSGAKGNKITFNASGSTDPDGSIAYYTWQWGDCTTTNTTDAVVTHTFNSTGVFTVSLVVKDDDLAGDYVRKQINITFDCTPPDIEIIAPANGTAFGYNNIGVWYTTTSTDVAYALVAVDGRTSCPEPYNNTWNDTGGGLWCKDPNGSPTGFKSLADGWHVLRVRHVDLSENIGPEDNVTVLVDSRAPVVNITSPANDSVFSVNWVEVNFTTPDGDVKKVEYAIGGGAWKDTGLGSISADTVYSHNFTFVPFGVHSLKIRVSDSGQSGQAYVTVNITSTGNTPPVVVINEPAEGSYHLFLDQINFTATDIQTSLLNCTYKIDAGPWNNNLNATSGVAKIQAITNQTVEATHMVYVKCGDGTLWSDVAQAEFIIDLTGPATTITYPANGANVSSGLMEYTATDAGVGVDYYEVKADAGGWTMKAVETHTFTLLDGAHTLYTRAVDKLGNTGAAVNVSITLDTVAPGLTITFPLNNTNTTVQSVSVWFSSSSPDVEQFYKKLDGGAWIPITGSPAAFPNISDGTHYRYIKAVDYAGNENVSNNKININANGPITIITAPTGVPKYIVDDVNVSFESNATDVDKFQYSYDGANWTDAVTGATNDTTYIHEFTNVPEGVGSLYIRGVDDVGNHGPPTSVTVNVSSIFTNLKVDLILPSSGISSTPFSVGVAVTNNNEEYIPMGNVEVNITTQCAVSGTNPKILGRINTSDGKDGKWTLSCSTGLENITGFMIYRPTNQTKSDTYVFEVKPLSDTPGEEKEEPTGEVFDVLGVKINPLENTVTFPEDSTTGLQTP